MDLKYFNRDKKSESSYPLTAYYIAKFLNRINPVVLFLDKIETLFLSKRISNFNDENPIYITGLARAGTTIILEMLSKHPDVATHRYIHIPMSYLPYIWTNFARKTKIFLNPVERLHKDGIVVNRESPEALEEVFWRDNFLNLHNEDSSSVMNNEVSNENFETFYRNHIAKLLFTLKKSRYLTKNNYNVTRLEYLLQIFPKSKFLLIIRNPISHIASLIKQNILFRKMGLVDPRLEHFTQLIGHYEFGYNRKSINIGSNQIIKNIREIWSKNYNDVKGWALYWASIYSFIAGVLNKNKKLAKATLIVRYEDLVSMPSETIDKILEHTQLNKEKFLNTKEYYIKNLHKPTYYQAIFSKKELKDIAEITDSTISLFSNL